MKDVQAVVLLLLYVWVEIVQIVFLTMVTVRFSQAAERRQQYVRIPHLPVVHLMHHAHCCLR